MTRTALTSLAGLAFALGAFGATAAHAALIIEGNHRVSVERIRSFLPGRADGAYSDAELDAALKAMLASNEFESASLTRRGSDIHVVVSENPVVVRRIAFEGNHKLGDKELQPLLQTKAGAPLSRALLRDDINRMLMAYHHAGRLQASIEPELIAVGKDGSSDLVFKVSEGKRVGLRQIAFRGNGALPDRKLKDAIGSGESNLLSFLLNNDLYDPDRIEQDRGRIEHLYRHSGYPDVRVEIEQPELSAAPAAMTLTFDVSEGPRVTIGDVTVECRLHAIDVHPLEILVLPRKGDLYDIDAIDRTMTLIRRELARQGRPFVDIQPVVERHGTVADLAFRVTQGRPLYVERIEIRGNGKTADEVIRREIRLAEGDAWNAEEVERTEQRIKRLGHFKTVKITRAEGSATDRAVLTVNVTEQDSGSFFISGGYGTVDGWMGSIEAGDSNLFGRGDALKGSVTLGQYIKGFDLAFTHPYLFGQNLTGSASLYAKQTDASSYQSYNSTFAGGKIGIAAPVTDNLTFALRYGLDRQEVSLPSTSTAVSLPIREAAAAGPQWVSSIGLGTTWSTLDNPRNPTTGTRIDLANDLAGLGGDVNYFRSTATLRQYQDLGAGVVGMSKAQAGYITPWGGQSLPLLNGFFGGPQLVRGFAPNGFGPRDLTPGSTHDNVGGNQYWATSYELQSAIPGIPSSMGLKAAVFADAGSLWRTSAAGSSVSLSGSLIGNSRAVRSSVGAGLVWDSILGPIRVDYAYPLTKTNYDVTQRLHFGYGLF